MVLRVAIGGFGAIGKVVAERLDRGIEGLALAAVSARDPARAAAAMAGFSRPAPVAPLARLWEEADIVIECAPAAPAARDRRAGAGPRPPGHGPELRRAPRQFRSGRVGAPARRPDSGAERRIARARCGDGGGRGRNLQASTWSRASRRAGLRARPISTGTASRSTNLQAPKCVFAGNAREAARGFPANVNVAAALALAGIGPERTTIEIWADPGVDRNIHRIEVEADGRGCRCRSKMCPRPKIRRPGG